MAEYFSEEVIEEDSPANSLKDVSSVLSIGFSIQRASRYNLFPAIWMAISLPSPLSFKEVGEDARMMVSTFSTCTQATESTCVRWLSSTQIRSSHVSLMRFRIFCCKD
jgi:hypothetical protein